MAAGEKLSYLCCRSWPDFTVHRSDARFETFDDVPQGGVCEEWCSSPPDGLGLVLTFKACSRSARTVPGVEHEIAGQQVALRKVVVSGGF